MYGHCSSTIVLSGRLTLNNIDRIEQVQRRFSKRLRGLSNHTYENRLKRLNVPSFELRRLHNDLAWCYRIVFGLTVLKFDELFEWNPATQTRGHAFKLYKRNCTHRSRAVFFSEHVINAMEPTICFN